MLSKLISLPKDPNVANARLHALLDFLSNGLATLQRETFRGDLTSLVSSHNQKTCALWLYPCDLSLQLLVILRLCNCCIDDAAIEKAQLQHKRNMLRFFSSCLHGCGVFINNCSLVT